MRFVTLHYFFMTNSIEFTREKKKIIFICEKNEKMKKELEMKIQVDPLRATRILFLGKYFREMKLEILLLARVLSILSLKYWKLG